MKLKFIPAYFFPVCFVAIFFSCKKDSGITANNQIQQGDSVIEIFALYVTSPTAALLIKYNDVIDAPISGTLTFYVNGGQPHDIPFRIPAGNKKLESWGGDNYLNLWYYNSYYDSTSGGTPPPTIDGNWTIDSLKITAVNCSNKTYGFKVIKASDNWIYYHPTDPITSISFVSNGDSVKYSDYAFAASTTVYNRAGSLYDFYFLNVDVEMFSNASTYPFQNGLTMNIPFLRYYWNSRNYGSQLDAADTASNGSTLKLTVTNTTDKYYDATFSGKIWSTLSPDTLFISDGKIENALLPIKQ